jgi:hypothetical protein
MTDRRSTAFRRCCNLTLAGAGVVLGLTQFVSTTPAGAATTTAAPSSQPVIELAAATSTTVLTLDQWKQRYERDVGILADDVLVVVDDGKRAQHHDTKAKVKTTVNDCRTWASDAGQARMAAPPIPMADAERAWSTMISASARAASDCLAALKHGSRRSAKDFQKQLTIVEKDEVTLNRDLNGSSAPPGNS